MGCRNLHQRFVDVFALNVGVSVHINVHLYQFAQKTTTHRPGQKCARKRSLHTEQHVLVDIVLGGSTNLWMSINQVINHETTMMIITEGRDRVIQSPVITDQARYPDQGTYDARLRSYVS